MWRNAPPFSWFVDERKIMKHFVAQYEISLEQIMLDRQIKKRAEVIGLTIETDRHGRAGDDL